MDKGRRLSIIAGCLLLISAVFLFAIAVMDLCECERALEVLAILFDAAVGLLGVPRFLELGEIGWYSMSYIYLCIGVFDTLCAVFLLARKTRLKKAAVVRCFAGCAFGLLPINFALHMGFGFLAYLEGLIYLVFYGTIAVLLLMVPRQP